VTAIIPKDSAAFNSGVSEKIFQKAIAGQ